MNQAHEKVKELKGPPLAALYSQLANSFFFQNKFLDAIKWMNKALSTNDLDAKTVAHNHYNLACAYHETNALRQTFVVAQKTSPEVLAKYTGLARQDTQLAKFRCRPEFRKLMAEFSR